MFGASLGKVQQRKVEKKASSQLGANDSSRVESSVFGFLDIQAALNAIPTSESGGDEGKMRKRLPKGTKPILYSADKGAGPDVMLKFFHAVTDMLMDPENIREIVAESNANNVPLFVQSMNFQKDVLEYNFQIEREYGCAQLGLVAVKYPDNPELVAAAKKFMLVAMESYVEQVKYRAAERFQKIRKASGLKENANVLRTAGGMTKQDYLEFFEACNAVMPLPHTRAALKKEFEVSGEKFEQVGKMAIAIQRKTLGSESVAGGEGESVFLAGTAQSRQTTGLPGKAPPILQGWRSSFEPPPSLLPPSTVLPSFLPFIPSFNHTVLPSFLPSFLSILSLNIQYSVFLPSLIFCPLTFCLPSFLPIYLGGDIVL